MKISLEKFSGYSIHGYEPGSVSVRGKPRAENPAAEPEITVHRRSIIVTPDTVVADWEPDSFEQLQPAHLERLMHFRPEVVLLGSGNAMRFPGPELLRPLVNSGIGYEVMDTGAACRTYNILAAEGRIVAAGLIVE